MKNTIIVFLFLLCITSFTSCIDIIEEIYLNKDGSGKYTMRMDMSGIIEAEAAELSKRGENLKPFDEAEIIDSIMYFKDFPSEIKTQFADNTEFLNKLNIHLQLNPAEGIYLLSYNLDFENMDDINFFYKNRDKLMTGRLSHGMDEEGRIGDAGDPFGFDDDRGLSSILEFMGDISNSPDTRLFDYNRKKCMLTRYAQSAYTVSSEWDESEAKELMRMIFENATYTTIYHLPGKVKKITNDATTLSRDKKTVTLEGSCVEVMEGKFSLDNVIKFK